MQQHGTTMKNICICFGQPGYLCDVSNGILRIIFNAFKSSQGKGVNVED